MDRRRRDLPPELGRPDTAHRALRRWARAGILDHLLAALAGPFASDALRRLEYPICRAWRRCARIATMHSLLLAKRLGLLDALPCAPWHLPNPDLSETYLAQSLDLVREAAADPHSFDERRLRWIGDLLRDVGGRRGAFRLK